MNKMKKLIISLLICLSLVSPLAANAQYTLSPEIISLSQTNPEARAVVIQILTLWITMLQQQINEILGQQGQPPIVQNITQSPSRSEVPIIEGCMDFYSANYDSRANKDNGSCYRLEELKATCTTDTPQAKPFTSVKFKINPTGGDGQYYIDGLGCTGHICETYFTDFELGLQTRQVQVKSVDKKIKVSCEVEIVK